MNKQTELKLKQLYDKYTMIQMMLFCLTEKRTGKWLNKGDTIYINDLEDVKIIEDNNGNLRAVQISNDYSCPIDDDKIIDIINELRPKPKKKKATPKKNYKVWFQVMGRYTDSNNTGYGMVEATSKEEALKFAEEDLKRGMFDEIKIENHLEIFDEDDYEEDEEEYDDEEDEEVCWSVDWSGKGKHGTYCGNSMPYAQTPEEAIALQKKDLTRPDWFYGFEDELRVDE